MKPIIIIILIILSISCKKNESESDVNLKIQTPFRYGHGYAFLYKNSEFLDSIWFQGDGSFNGMYSSVPGNTNFKVIIRRLASTGDTTAKDTGSATVQWGTFNKITQTKYLHFDSLTITRQSSFIIP